MRACDASSVWLGVLSEGCHTLEPHERLEPCAQVSPALDTLAMENQCGLPDAYRRVRVPRSHDEVEGRALELYEVVDGLYYGMPIGDRQGSFRQEVVLDVYDQQG